VCVCRATCTDTVTNAAAPQTIADFFSSVLGDGFHLMDRPKVPVHHDSKKGYFHALQEAFFAWDPVVLEEVKDVLRQNGESEKQIENKMYFNVDYFRARVPRVILPPSKLYRRVRAVFELYGNKIHAKTKVPLFNKRAWARAKNVLADILAGFASDPPGYTMYTRKLDKHDRPAQDVYGIALLECLRGTNRTESFHKQFIETFGGWHTGVAMADYLLAERRHRHNQHVSERRRWEFPRLGHSDTWLIDDLQLVVERNHNVLLYPHWSNTSDFEITPESFGTVGLHSKTLGDAIEAIDVDMSIIKLKLTPDQLYLCSAMKTNLPLLPVDTVQEHQLFEKLVLKMHPINYDDMALEWCKSVDGENIFPKLPVYLRTFHKTWEHNQRVQRAVERAATGEAKLAKLNTDTMAAHVAAQGAAPAPSLVIPAVGAGGSSLRPTAGGWRIPVRMPSVISQPTMPAIPLAPMTVAGMTIGSHLHTRLATVDLTTLVLPKKKIGQRGTCKKQRKPPTCRRCTHHKETNAQIASCKGRASRGFCKYACHKCNKGNQSCSCQY